MVIIRKSLDEMLAEIEFEEFVRYDHIVPEEKCNLGLSERGSNSEKPRYIKSVEEFVGYLHELRDFLAAYNIEVVGPWHTFSDLCPFSTALENAFYNGNQMQEEYPISCKVFLGKKGIVIRIRDSGIGFDYAKTQQKFENGGIYYKFQGKGFKAYNNKLAEVAFESNGTIINIMYKYGSITLTELEEKTFRFGEEEYRRFRRSVLSEQKM